MDAGSFPGRRSSVHGSELSCHSGPCRSPAFASPGFPALGLCVPESGYKVKLKTATSRPRESRLWRESVRTRPVGRWFFPFHGCKMMRL